jgi:hypothetical protein
MRWCGRRSRNQQQHDSRMPDMSTNPQFKLRNDSNFNRGRVRIGTLTCDRLLKYLAYAVFVI